MRLCTAPGMLLLLLVVSSCVGTGEYWLSREEQAEKAHRLQEQRQKEAVADQIDKAQLLLEERQPDLARKILLPLLQQPFYLEDIHALLETADSITPELSIASSKRLTDVRALDEVHDRLTLPDTYGSTRIISPQLEPLELPPGPMEEILNRRIAQIDLEGADVQLILQALRDQHGLNIIADQALQSDQQLFIHAKDIPVHELLSYISRNMGIAFHLGENVIWVTEAQAPPDNGPKLETRIYTLRKGYIPGGSQVQGFAGISDDDDDDFNAGDEGGGQASEGQDDLLNALTEFLTDNPDNPPNTKFQIYRNRNLLIIRNTRENLRLAEELIRQFDDVPLQVLIEARFITISQTDLLRLGARINSITYDGGSSLNLAGAATLPGYTIGADRLLGVSGIIDNFTYDIVLDALKQSSSARTLSVPRVTVLNNQAAQIRRGENVLYFDEFEVVEDETETELFSNLQPVDEAKELELGISLGATPSIGNDGKTIVLSLSTQILDLIEFIEQNNVSLPRTNESSLTTSVAVNSGQTVVMGGMITTNENRARSRIPILGDIPILGFIFRKKDLSEEPDHLLIFVTATIVDRDGRFNAVVDDQATP